MADSATMSDDIILDDGRVLHGSSIGVAGALALVAEQLPERHDQFRTWLIDVSERSNGFASVDLRGLPERERHAFHAGVRAAHDQTIGAGMQIGPNSWALGCLNRLRAMLESMARGEPPEALTDRPPSDPGSVVAEDLSQLWKPDRGNSASSSS